MKEDKSKKNRTKETNQKWTKDDKSGIIEEDKTQGDTTGQRKPNQLVAGQNKRVTVAR